MDLIHLRRIFDERLTFIFNVRNPAIITTVYTFVMTRRAKISTNGGSQAVRLPESVRFPESQTEVIVRKSGKRVILEPVDEWSEEFLSSLGAWDEDIERLPQTPVSELKGPSTR